MRADRALADCAENKGTFGDKDGLGYDFGLDVEVETDLLESESTRLLLKIFCFLLTLFAIFESEVELLFNEVVALSAALDALKFNLD